jgi:hypothetical protein
MYDMATQFSNSSWARFLDERLANFITTPDEVAYKVRAVTRVPAVNNYTCS